MRSSTSISQGRRNSRGWRKRATCCATRALREGYLAAFKEYLENVRRKCARQLIDYQTIRTSEHLDAALAYYLNHRIGMYRAATR